jgi:hypothetical protein
MYICIQYVIQYLIQSGLHTSSHVHPITPCAFLFLSCSHPVPQAHSILHCRSHSSGAIGSFLHSTNSGSSHCCMSLHSALVHWTVDKRLDELHVSPMIKNEVVDWLQESLVFRRRKNERDIPLRLNKYMRLPWSGRTFWQVHNSLILELTVKVIISVIVKYYVEGKMQFHCSHMSREVSVGGTFKFL